MSDGGDSSGPWTVEVFRPFVEEVLDEWKNDTLFMEIGLNAYDTIIKDDEAIPGKDEKQHPFNKIFDLVAKKVVDKYDLDKKTKKTMTILLRSFNEKWVPLIKTMQIQSPVKKREQSSQPEEEEEATVNNHEQSEESKALNERKEDDDEAEETTVSEGNGRSEIDVDLTPKQLQMKEDFEKSKQEVLDSLPVEVKSRFGQQYFSKWGKNPLPCLVLNPYNVPPGGVRQMWFEMYEKVKEQGRLTAATNLVYWYGAYDDPTNAYSFVVSSKLTPYEQGVTKGMKKIPNTIQKKIDTGKKLSAADRTLVQGLEEMEEDRAKEPDERHGRMHNAFVEEWEFVDEEEKETKQEETEKLPKSKSKPKKLKKRKKEDSAEAKPKNTKKVKKEEPNDPIKIDVPAAEEKAEEPAVTSGKVGDLEDIGDDDISSHDDKDDVEDAEPSSESDEDDEDYQVTKRAKKSKTPPKKPIKAKAAKSMPKKKAQKTKTKIVKGPKGSKKVPEGERLRKQEQAKFTQCENEYLQVIDRWKYGIDNHSKGSLKESYKSLLECVEKFSAPFIEAYEMPAMMKQSKRILGDDENRLKLWKLMKEVYQTKKKDVPAGFIPEKRVHKSDVSEKQAEEKPKRTASVEEIAENDKLSAKVPTKAKVEKQDTPSSTTTKSAPPSAPATEKKRKFTLGDMFSKPKSASKPNITSSLNRSASSSQLTKRQNNPQWTSETSIKDIPKDENRAFALEFLQQATPFIPPNDNVNPDVIARELEAAIFKSACGQEEKPITEHFVKYWDKVDDMVAAISGEGGNGTIARLISQGQFPSAAAVVGLTDNDIACSYEGRALEDFKFD